MNLNTLYECIKYQNQHQLNMSEQFVISFEMQQNNNNNIYLRFNENDNQLRSGDIPSRSGIYLRFGENNNPSQSSIDVNFRNNIISLRNQFNNNIMMSFSRFDKCCSQHHFKILKPIDKSKNSECPITFEPIKYGDTYLTCSKCKYNFGEKDIMTHLNTSYNNVCPMCRSTWDDYSVYVNKEQINAEKIKKNFELNCSIRVFQKTNSNLTEYMNCYTKHNKRWHYGK